MFSKNMDFFTSQQAAQIEHAKVAVIGVGALGQMTAHQLARSGFKQLILVDKDHMAQSNFNRQFYADNTTLGQSKVEVTKTKLLDINPEMSVKVYDTFLDEGNGPLLIDKADVIVDCVDDIATKKYLEKLACQLNVPLIHGAVEGWFGQVASVFPGEHTVSKLYPSEKNQSVTALMVTVSTVSALQVGEVIKVITGMGEVIRKKVLFIDLMNNDFSYINMGE